MSQEIQVNIRCMFGGRFLKDSFFLEIPATSRLQDILRLIDKRLEIKFLAKSKKKALSGIVMLLNGERIDPLVDSKTIIRHQDQLSILSALGGG